MRCLLLFLVLVLGCRTPRSEAYAKGERLTFVHERREAGATDEEILRDIKRYFPDWYKEIQDSGGGLDVVAEDAN